MPVEIETASDPTFGPIQRQVNKLMEQMQKGFFNFCPSETWTPNVNLYETEGAYLVCADLAGVIKEQIEVQVVEHRLTLRGRRAVPVSPVAEPGEAAPEPGLDSAPRYRVHLMEIDHGTFCREVELPEDVVEDRIAATHRNGLLWIELPKK